MSKPKIVLIHGNGGGTASDHWFPYAKQKLEEKGFTVTAETMPDNVLAHESVWLPFMETPLAIDEDSVIIGHSSGAVAAMRYAESHKIYGSILIGACYTDLGDDSERESGYYNHTWHWGNIRKNQKWIIQFASIDDPYIPVAEARFVQEKLETEYHESDHEGHYGSDVQEKLEFPELIEVLLNKF